MDAFPKFTGNCPRNVAKDAKYAIRSGPGGPVVALVYRAKAGERWLATTEDHPELVRIVNAVKRAHGDSQHGPFYINEYRQVLVPVGRGQNGAVVRGAVVGRSQVSAGSQTPRPAGRHPGNPEDTG
ncbi:MAG: hypothetical protein K6U89_16995 [Chloroflexi bacterium]|nr:hypothetical protein [Chloroflexota bacterium]